MKKSRGLAGVDTVEICCTSDLSGSRASFEKAIWAICHGIEQRVVMAFLVLLLSVQVTAAESSNEVGSSEGVTSQRQAEITDARKVGIPNSIRALLVTDAATRALDAYSTVRMLRNKCDGNLSIPVCNEEMFLPGFITQSRGAIYSYEGGIWIAELYAVHKLAKRHKGLARLLPMVDIVTTLPFAVNNVHLPLESKAR